MDIYKIPVICVSYNSADLISDLLSSFRKFYKNTIYIIDGSESNYFEQIRQVTSNFDDVNFIHFDYNIHHGPGMAWAINNLNLTERVLFLDSDIFVVNGGFLESLNAALLPGMYGVGKINYVNEGGFDVDYEKGAIKYLHPACMLCNINVMREWPLPAKHGAPMTAAMTALHKADATDLLRHIPWLVNDFTVDSVKTYIRHDWRGTVTRTGGYHLDEWLSGAQEEAEFQRKLLALVPANVNRLVEVGCGSGSIGRAHKQLNPNCHYTGLNPDRSQLRLAGAFYDTVDDLNFDWESISKLDFQLFQGTDCWILNHVLESIRNPWDLLKKIRQTISRTGCIVAVIQNSQHWMIQAKLAVGDFRYSESDFLNKNQIRFYTRATIFEIFQETGFRIEQGFPRITLESSNENVILAIKQMAKAVGADSELAWQDSVPSHYVVQAVLL
jgi:trans-aconitate methyltransferase